MTIKIGIIGSCATRDIFRTVYNYKYSDDFEICFDYERISFISLMSNPINYEKNMLKIFPENPSNLARTSRLIDDFNGNKFFDNVKNVDYILIDLYFEVKFGIILGSNQEVYTNNYWDYPYTEYYNKIKNNNELNINENFSSYFIKFKKAFDLFYHKIEKEFSNSKIILNSLRFINNMKMKNGEIIQKFSKEYTDKYNKSIINLEKYIIENYDVDVILFEETLLDENHIWGTNDVHFTPNYYQYTYRKLIKLINNPNKQDNLILSNKTKLLKYMGARIDFMTFQPRNLVEVIYSSDNEMSLYYSDYYKKQEKNVITIQSYNGSLDLKIRCEKEDLLKIFLRGFYFTDYFSENKPLYIVFEKLIVNGSDIINDKTIVCHDNPYECEYPITKGTIDIHLEWSPLY